MRERTKTDIKIGVIGIGTIGSGVLKTFQLNQNLMERRLGFPISIKWVCDLDFSKAKELDLSVYQKTNNYKDVLNDPEVDIVVELIGGIHPAKEILLEALKKGKHVVTANKALLAEEGEEIFTTAKELNRDIGFEASVAGGIPIIKVLKEGLCANDILRIYGIVNGTANYLLTKMEEENLSFEESLRKAQEKGYAEADPTLDIEGIDAAHKTAILATLAFGSFFGLKDVYTEGISKITHLDVLFAKELGYRIKLLAIIKKSNSEVELRVHPTLIPLDSSMAGVRGAYNALSVVGNVVGHVMLYGMGAGMMPTASAVVADIMDIARNIFSNSSNRVPSLAYSSLEQMDIKSMDNISSKYYLRFSALDKPGVLSKISGILAKYSISIESVIQKGRKEKGFVPIVMTTHEALESSMRKAILEIDQLEIIGSPTTIIRVENNIT
ncbi:homoserine dehydrogenase [Thermosulfidibacter takaii ABI70S6]|uniref:Homoserine dehydrogenase n=1 Tax=Thermosulfidibacter takaii (strain DSM 17441 / JCM 13301 / NBRC 103674 / ABI70S6) TaxID=1298851 RepID=A0A0S3QW32_THET7|nr:homoserine dehydrogenase [Thermosulfidibacter takaii]BAT72539.1 homoserine dehydrogenase [Thermosulfidibacter takaii ABI70S6]